jgi:Fic family protein
MFIHERSEWPYFRWQEEKVNPRLAHVRYLQGHLLGKMGELGFDIRQEASLEVLTSDVVKTSSIEGEILDPQSVRSSLAKKLGIETASIMPRDRHIDGVVDMLLDATRNYNSPLTKDRLFGWHALLFPTGRSGLKQIRVGAWRTEQEGPMQVVSGPIGREKIHFEAPEAQKVDAEMSSFLFWFNEEHTLDLVLKAGIAHFWFVTIHPFVDGNGRIGRALMDLLLTRSDQSKDRFYSMSAWIEKERAQYYDRLEWAQKGDLDITEWLLWFLECLEHAIKGSEILLESTLNKSRLWKKASAHGLNGRQIKILNLMLGDFEGHLTTGKYAKIAKCSQDTALRDIKELLSYNLLQQNPEGGRSTSYILV